MELLDRGIVFDATRAPAGRRVAFFTNVVVLSDGAILVTFRAGSSKDSADEHILMHVSRDAGEHAYFLGFAVLLTFIRLDCFPVMDDTIHVMHIDI